MDGSDVVVLRGDCLSWLHNQPDRSVDLVIGSPPYAGKGKRYAGSAESWPVDKWVPWMADVTAQAVRVSRGFVLWVCAGRVQQYRYEPSPELLLSECYRRGIACERPVIWSKNAPPTRKGDWFSNSWEYVLAFRSQAARLPFHWQAIAESPRFTNGGDFRLRGPNGKRRNGSSYPKGRLTNPKDVVRFTVGGGHMGFDTIDDRLANEGEAPFPLMLAEHFIKALTLPSDVVLDPFVGSGTTLVAAQRLGRSGIGVDVSEAAVALAQRRLQHLSNVAAAASQ
jgi:site-specific DNA-methyltransferase (adenine-specific)/site-specific DNA-methyltransferase (cytosine-N4-specific)